MGFIVVMRVAAMVRDSNGLSTLSYVADIKLIILINVFKTPKRIKFSPNPKEVSLLVEECPHTQLKLA